MTKRTVGTLFCCLAVVLFLSRYIIALWYRGAGHTQWGADDFATHLSYVGVAPWILATGFLLAGIVYLVRSDSDK
jgi:hypothetical protein